MKEILNRIAKYRRKKEQFIDEVRRGMNETSSNEQERINRNGVFDTLLNLATYAKATELEIEFKKTLPQVKNESLDYMKNQLREINGVCTQTFSDRHDIYEQLFQNLAISETAKEEWRTELSASMTKLIIAKTTYDVPFNFNVCI